MIHKNEIKSITKPIIIREGDGIAVLFHGSIGDEVMKALENLEKFPMVISIPMIQPLDFDFLLEKLKNIHTLLTVEEHFVEGGLGTVMSEWIIREKLHFRLQKLGLKK